MSSPDAEQAFLLRSLDDLDRERAAGDITPHDYELLRNDYTARAAAALREGANRRGGAERRPVPARSQRPTRTALIAAVVLIGAIGSGVLVARSAGERVGNAGLTGTVRSASTDRTGTSTEVEQLLADGRSMMATDPVGALKAFDRATALDPTRVEAIAYGGWIVRLVARSSQDDAQRTELLSAARARLDRAIATDPSYPDARAFRGILLLRDLNDPKAALADFTALDRLDPPPFVKNLVKGAEEDARAAA